MGLMSRLDMSTCQTSIKTDMLLECCHSPHLGSIGPTQDHHIMSPNYQTEQEGALVKHN